MSGNQHETKETDGDDKEEKHQDNTDNDIGPKMARASNDHGEDPSTLVPETSAVASESQRENEEKEGGCKEAKDEDSVYDEETKRSTTTDAILSLRDLDVSMHLK